MKILLVHNRYQQRGGEDAVFQAEDDLLETNGHTVSRLIFENESIEHRPSAMKMVTLGFAATWSRASARQVREEVERLQPNIVHFHNTFPLISPAAYYACRASAVVQSLHNYRLICPGGLLFRDGHVCHDCVGKSIPWNGAVHGCYRNSRSQTAATSLMLTAHHALGTWTDQVDRYIALSNFSREQFIQGGLPAEKITVKPNFVNMKMRNTQSRENFFLYVGRLSSEKGVETLVQSWQQAKLTVPLFVVGEGPLANLVNEASKEWSWIQSLGYLPKTEVLDLMRRARALVVPSICYEGFPVAIAEALACALPIVASRLGAMAEIVQDGQTGMLFEASNGDDLAEKICWMLKNAAETEKMGKQGRLDYEAKYTPEVNYEMLMDIYSSAIHQAAIRRNVGSRS